MITYVNLHTTLSSSFLEENFQRINMQYKRRKKKKKKKKKTDQAP